MMSFQEATTTTTSYQTYKKYTRTIHRNFRRHLRHGHFFVALYSPLLLAFVPVKMLEVKVLEVLLLNRPTVMAS